MKAEHTIKLERRQASPRRLTPVTDWTPRECPGFRPQPSLGDRLNVIFAVVVMGVGALLWLLDFALGFLTRS